MTDSTRRREGGKAVRKPKRPRPDFPLGIHKGTGYWCKKIRGRVYYFGKAADDPKGKAAMEQWLREKDDLLAGREPRAKIEGLTVSRLCDAFYNAKLSLRDNGELSPRTVQTYHATCETVSQYLGRNRIVDDVAPADFRELRKKLAKTRGAVALGNEIQRVRSVFKFAYEEGLIDAPMRFGQAFGKPKSEVVDRAREEHRMEHGPRMFEAAEIRRIIETAKQPLRAMVLLGINCGFGNTDLSSLPMLVVKNLDDGWIDYPRPKTGVRRRCWLWPETVTALREWLAERPKAKEPADAGLLFLTCRGQRWVKVNAKGTPADAICGEFGKVLRPLGLKRARVGFYALRHTFETIAGETVDQVAVDAVMGHKVKGMKANYIERIGDDRLRRVSEHVRSWLFPPETEDLTPPDLEGDGPAEKKNLEISDPIDPATLSGSGSEGSETRSGSKGRKGSKISNSFLPEEVSHVE